MGGTDVCPPQGQMLDVKRQIPDGQETTSRELGEKRNSAKRTSGDDSSTVSTGHTPSSPKLPREAGGLNQSVLILFCFSQNPQAFSPLP